MGRYYFHYQKKDTVEEYSRVLSIFALKRDKFIRSWEYSQSSTLTWSRNWEPNGSIGIHIEKDDFVWTLRVKFTQTDREGEKKSHDYTIFLESTPCHFWGGRRWWFLCPCKSNRCAKLYLQSNGVFASRETLDLTYESKNQSKRWKHLDLVFGPREEDINDLCASIKYPYRNGQPTRKMKKYIDLVTPRHTLAEKERMLEEIFGEMTTG